MRAGPIPDSYWVEDGELLAGEHPGSRDETAARAKLATIRAAGVDTFLDLTEAGEYGLRPYEAQMRAILDTIDESLESSSIAAYSPI